ASAVRGEALTEDSVTVAVLLVALPAHDEVAGSVRCHRGPELDIRRVGVDLELGAKGSAGRVEALAEDAGAAAVLIARPSDHEPPAGVERDRGISLVARGVGVDLEVRTESRAAGVEAPAEDPIAASVSPIAVPDDH